MGIEIRNLNKKDYKTAIEFAKVGMHFDVYFEKGDKMLDKYSKFFWYSELLESTDCLAIYESNKLVGVLLAEMYDKPKIYKSISKKYLLNCLNLKEIEMLIQVQHYMLKIIILC